MPIFRKKEKITTNDLLLSIIGVDSEIVTTLKLVLAGSSIVFFSILFIYLFFILKSFLFLLFSLFL